jgi:hypothetical protein
LLLALPVFARFFSAFGKRGVEYGASDVLSLFIRMRRVFASFFFLSFLVALFLFGQAAAASHAIGHVQQKDADHADEVCVLCLAAAAFGSAAPLPVSLSFIPPGVRATADVMDIPVRGASPCCAYWGRAPPLLP